MKEVNVPCKSLVGRAMILIDSVMSKIPAYRTIKVLRKFKKQRHDISWWNISEKYIEQRTEHWTLKGTVAILFIAAIPTVILRLEIGFILNHFLPGLGKPIFIGLDIMIYLIMFSIFYF